MRQILTDYLRRHVLHVFLTVLDYRLGDRVHEAPSEQQLLALIFVLQVEHRWRWRQARQIDHQQWLGQLEGRHERRQIGRASCRESVCPYVSISVVDVALKNNNLTPPYIVSTMKQ